MKPKILTSGLALCIMVSLLLIISTGTIAQFPPSFPQPVIHDTIFTNSDLILSGSDVLIIENTDYNVNGNVYISGNAQLILRQSVLRINHYPRQEMFISDDAMVIADTSIFFDLVHAFFENSSQIIMNNCMFINLLQLGGQSTAHISNSYIYSEPFGLLQPGELCTVEINNSIIGAIGISLSDNINYNITNLVPGFFEYWTSDEAISPDLGYSLTLTNTEIKDNPGYSGGYEMGWNIMTNSSAKLTMSNSVLNKLVISFINENVSFSGLITRDPIDFTYKDISLINTTIQNQWGIFVDNGETTITDSEGIWLWPVGNLTTFVSNTKVNEFDPRDFTGTIFMAECTMNNGFEIYANCDFRLEGGIRLVDTDPLWDESSIMTRNYSVQLFDDASGSTMPGIALALEKDSIILWRDTTDMDGRVTFDIVFDYDTHLDKWQLISEDIDVWLNKDINIRSFTPQIIRLELTPDSMHYRQVVYVDDSNPLSGTGIPDDPFQDIQEAVNHCSRKGIVKVAPGIYDCSVTLADEIFLLGAGPDSSWIQADVLAWDVKDARITGFRIDDGQTAGIHCYDSKLLITNNVISGQPHNGIHSFNSDLTIINNTITGNGLNGIFLTGGSAAVLRNNIISSNNQAGVISELPELVLPDYNDLWNNGEGNYGNGITPGLNDINMNPVFADPMSQDYHLLENSPCIDAGDPDPAYNDPGGSRNDMGAYGGPYSNSPGQSLFTDEPWTMSENRLAQNYPNPFSEYTNIVYYLAEEETVVILIYDLVGNEIKTLVSSKQRAGRHSVVWDGLNYNGKKMPAGIYYCALSCGSGFFIRKMILAN